MMPWLASLRPGLPGEPSPHAGEGLEVTFNHTWPWPPWLTVLLLIAAATYVVAIYLHEPGRAPRWRRLIPAGVRILLIALVVTMMYGWMRDRYRTDLPDLVIAIDDSQSMGMVDQYTDRRLADELRQRCETLSLGEPNRINLAKSLLLESGGWLEQLRDRYHVKLYWLGTTARIRGGTAEDWQQAIRDLEPTEPASRLGHGLQDILEAQRGRPTAGVVLLTDGVTTEGRPISEAAHYARRKGIPLFPVGIGDDRPPRDLRLADLLVDDTVFVGDLVQFEVKVYGTGVETDSVTVRLRKSGSDEILDETEVPWRDDEGAHIARLSHRPLEEGEFRFLVEVEPLEDETNVENNQLSQVIRVRDETIRVLYVQEYPSPEFRFLKTLLERGLQLRGEGKAIALTTVLQEADIGYAELDQTAQRVFPVSREDLFEYDVVIFGDANPSFLSRAMLENLALFVKERGGGVVFIAGPRHVPTAYRGSPIEDLFPMDLGSVIVPPTGAVMEEEWSVELTRLGAASPHLQLADTLEDNAGLWSRLPPLRWLVETPDPHPAAQVLVRTTGSGPVERAALPVISSQFVGAGRVVYHATDESYLWSRHEGTDVYYERYWLQTLRYLSRTKLLGESRDVELTIDREQFYRGEQVLVRVRFLDDRVAPVADDGVAVWLERERGGRQRVRLHRDFGRRGVFEGTVGGLTEGTYRVGLAAPTLEDPPAAQRLTIVPPPGERERLVMDAQDLQLAAETSQGKFHSIGTAHRLPADLPAGRQVRLERLPSSPVWNSPFLAGLFVILIVLEWLWRKRLGWL
jgi:hypothetical protein